MSLKISISNTNKVINSIASKLGLEVIRVGAESQVNLPDGDGKGWIKSFEFQNGINFFHIEGSLSEDLILSFTGKEPQLKMAFCLEGKTEIISGSENMLLQPLQSTIFLRQEDDRTEIKFPGNSRLNFYLIDMGKEDFLKRMGKPLDTNARLLIKIFNRPRDDSRFFNDDRYSLITPDIFNEMWENNFTGALKQIYIEACVLKVISYQLKSYLDDIRTDGEAGALRRKDVGLLFEARQILQKQMQNPPTIKELARLVGTNENKLKKGFKQLFGKTIANFIIDKRLEYARILLDEELLSIKEIAEQSGYQSPSAFTKVFKKKFGITPKQFLKK